MTVLSSMMSGDDAGARPARAAGGGAPPGSGQTRETFTTGVGEREDPVAAELRAHPGLLAAAERDVGGQREVLVDPAHTTVQAARDLGRGLQVGAPHRVAEAELGAVDPGDDLVDVVGERVVG
ncbi:hypothetical protein GCM10023215_20300 [Pseudonocardia yuanmonensis]|uniref:Uncharacterized protein n=1 Tax=Pseudonocardia yuanmonensis TaxID=1095914 RepID=A0ABP8WB60_9PSEU